ncbi:MAG: tRNA guanosine(15) transglycosylase TgtA [Candidatus Bathyarchaeota archaeon]|nr:tRNA guanosine(15) transglycosylase TgtA [Candidatus Bathyarchaeota archaeon]
MSIKKKIGSDIATILDIPTGWKVSHKHAKITVTNTLLRAREFFKTKTEDQILWVGPVQGGRHLDLVKESAKAIGKMPFQIHALGSPTEVMENYRFDVLTDMILTAKQNLPTNRPLHLFGAGHPFMFSLAVALGCDLFDSAAYALYARQNRYMTENGTWQLTKLDFFPCSCPKCVNKTPKEVLNKSAKDREIFLAEHNLFVCIAELRRIKQAIREGRLWELVEMRTHAHPALFSAFKKIKKQSELIEKLSPTIKKRGLFFFSSAGLARPEIVHYRNKILKNYQPPNYSKILLLLPQTRKKPYHKAHIFKKIKKIIKNISEKNRDTIHICFYAAPFGIIPIELDEIYPLSQNEITFPLDYETKEYVTIQISEYIKHFHYKTVILLNDPVHWDSKVTKTCKKICKIKKLKFEELSTKTEINKDILACLENILKKHLSDKY